MNLELIEELSRKVGIIVGMNEYLEPALFINREEVTNQISNLIGLVMTECIDVIGDQYGWYNGVYYNSLGDAIKERFGVK